MDAIGQEIAFILVQSELLLIFIELINYNSKTRNSFTLLKGDEPHTGVINSLMPEVLPLPTCKLWDPAAAIYL